MTVLHYIVYIIYCVIVLLCVTGPISPACTLETWAVGRLEPVVFLNRLLLGRHNHTVPLRGQPYVANDPLRSRKAEADGQK
ncbi:hypothetical protein M441DRAFT_210360 [Trichoderma asperellum CBS 433.97]|uniref:Uncharacterized protein n=1 Tax=Trichoderma asperellum (strain ATCC 204424 / CBS 433.97 / NBRC 101777) TaxID=1042311 RepID=A0A2T3ZMZ1_TRIA4|nr:hypothetical protein M441DRAFT_210360 [Trichoderma asperellum CBS 433.97]PTB46170.1 hypothetical protein M441DRAFT_210360 [Trichoderma asperellum CBS 433.97]